jgi:hypothetical protein
MWVLGISLYINHIQEGAMAFIGETLASGASSTCEDCGSVPELGVYRSAAGHYVGTYCDCGPYSRESGYYPSREDAQKALDSGEFGRPTEFVPAPLEVYVSTEDEAQDEIFCDVCGLYYDKEDPCPFH